MLWAVVWLPVYLFGQNIGLFFYPLWLALWLFLEITTIAGLVLCSIALAKEIPPHRRFWAVTAVVVAAIYVIGSLPALWWGSAPLALLGVTNL